MATSEPGRARLPLSLPAWMNFSMTKLAVTAGHPSVDELEWVLDALMNRIHELVNNSLRHLGVPCEDGMSEATWAVIQERLKGAVSGWVTSYHTRRAELRDARRARVQQLEAELSGLKAEMAAEDGG